MKGDYELTIVEISESLIDPRQRHETDVDYELVQAVEDRNWEVVVEWYVHLGRQLAFQVYCLPNRFYRYLWIQRADPVHVPKTVV